MLHDIISYIGTLDPTLIYVVLFISAFVENVFPPSPSDIILVIGATLVANTTVGFIPVLILTSAASGLGFIFMYFIGEYLGDKVIRSGKLKFIKKEELEKTDAWFLKYGYKLILINRFLPGTRAVISFFSGVHHLSRTKTFFMAFISSLLWNTLLILLGVFLGNNIDLIDKYLTTYSNIVLVIMILVIGFFIYKYYRNVKSKK
ncbi:MAG: DedA family protein [Ignavibacteria bacterium]|nr:DedA family protein [Ignavibacteria bacterium]